MGAGEGESTQTYTQTHTHTVQTDERFIDQALRHPSVGSCTQNENWKKTSINSVTLFAFSLFGWKYERNVYRETAGDFKNKVQSMSG